MNNENNNHDEDDFEMPKLDIRQENEFKKMKMNLEHGAIFPNDLSKQLPPEIEGQFLDSIMSFEKAFRNAKKISVYDKIGRPDFVPENVLNDHEVKESLEKIEFILADYQDEERLIYKFITEELFNVEVDDVRVPGFNTNFIYEEFHQNHKYDLERDTLDFLNMFLYKKSEIYEKFHSKNAVNHIELNNFRSLFKKFKIKLFEITNIVFDEQNAKTTFNIDFWGKMDSNPNKIYYTGEGTMTFEYKHGYWNVQNVVLPI
jgi:hypothetical protein